MALCSSQFVRSAVCGGTVAVVLLTLALSRPQPDTRRSKSPGPGEGQSAALDGDGAAEARTDSRSDVIVVGAGISGLSAALELGRGGATVTVLDMSSVFGGHAVMAQGSLFIVQSPVQEAAGLKDSPELAFQDFIRHGEDVNEEWVRYYIENCRRDVFDWVSDLGVRFSGVSLAPGNPVEREHQPDRVLGHGVR